MKKMMNAAQVKSGFKSMMQRCNRMKEASVLCLNIFGIPCSRVDDKQ